MGQEYSKHFEAEAQEVEGNGKVFGHINGLNWLPPSQSMAVKQPQTVPETHIKHRLFDPTPKSSSANPVAAAAQSEQQQGEEKELAAAAGIPVLDLAQLELGGESAAEFKRKIAHACEEWGFFQVVNHGVEQSLVDDYMRVVREFFALPLEEKAKLVGSNFNSPALYATRTKDWSDFLRLKCEPISDPDTTRWPEKPVDFRFR